MAELSLAASRRLKLRQLADDGDPRAAQVLKVQEQPGYYFTVVQIGVNTLAILAGVVGEGALTPHFEELLRPWMEIDVAQRLSFALSFASVTVLFVVLADLFPKRLSMNEPEQVAMVLVGPMLWLTILLRPLAWVLNTAADGLLRLLGRPVSPDNSITAGDILALAEAGHQAGVMAQAEQQVIENVFELETRTVESSMTSRERVVYFSLDDDEALVRTRIADSPHSTYLVCDKDIDHVVGYVDATDLFQRVLRGEVISLRAEPALIKKVLIVPDRLTLSEVLTQFRQAHEDFAVIVNEYSLVVGVITLNDVMSTVMGALVQTDEEEQQIIRRDDGSFLADGITPIPDVQRALNLDDFPHPGQYDTLAGFLMVMLRRIPKRTDVVEWSGWRFEVVDVDSHRVDQVMIESVAAHAASAATMNEGR